MEKDWFWLRSKENVGDYVWFFPDDPNDNTDANCLSLIPGVPGYKAVGRACDKDSRNHFPICQIK